MLHPVNSLLCDLDRILAPQLRPVSLISPKDPIFANKFILPFVLRRGTAMEDCLPALRGWMTDERDILTLDPAVVMVAQIIAVPLMVLWAMFADVSMSISMNVIANSP